MWTSCFPVGNLSARYPYYSEKRQKIQAICPCFEKQENFHTVENDVDRLFAAC